MEKSSLDTLLKERDRYDKLMFDVLEGKRHLTSKGTTVSLPISEEQKAKDNFLFKYYEAQFNKIEAQIQYEIRH